MAARWLKEGFSARVVDGVRRFFSRSPEQQRFDLKRGGLPMTARAGLPYNLVSQFGYDLLAAHLYIDQDLQARFTDYEEMDEYPEITTALDIYADDATTPDMDREQSIWAVSRDKAIADNLNNMLHKRMVIEDDSWGAVRELCKYGNLYGEVLLAEGGVVGLNFLPPPTMRRVEDPRGNLLGFVQDVHGRFNISLEDFYKLADQRQQGQDRISPPGVATVFEDWEVIHWRLRGKYLRSTYGHAVVEPARYPWKRLSLLEDALLIYKMERAPSRWAFYIDVGEMDMERGMAYVNRVKNGFTRKKFVNPNTGKLDMRYNPLAHDEDFFVPVRAGKRSSEIEMLQGPDYTETESLEYMRDKLTSALKMPKTYMGYGGEEVRGPLTSADIRFARTEMRIQRIFRGGVRQVCRIHLIATTNKNPDELDYDTRMAIPSQILDLARVEVMSAKADLAQRMKEDVGDRWVLVHIYGFTEDEAALVMKERDERALKRGEIEAKVERMRMGEEVEGPKARRLDESEVLERRLSQFVHAVRKGDWRRDFEGGGRRAEIRAEAKLNRVLAENQGLSRRLLRLGGLMNDIRRELRRGGASALPS